MIALLFWFGIQRFRWVTRHGEYIGEADLRLHKEDKEELANEASLLATAK
jgi:hypothetical protein